VRLQLGAELQRTRQLSGIGQKDLADRLKVSQSLVSRVESGTRLLARPELQKWLRTTKADAPIRERVLALAEAAHTDTRTWNQLLGGAGGQLQDEAARRNAAARLVQNFQPTVLPGLLQTADYARAVIPLADITGRIDHAAHLARRLERQDVIQEPGRSFAFLIAERLLRWEPAPGTLGPQLAQLRAAVELDAVDLAVLPDSYAGALPWHNFVIRYPIDPEDVPAVSVELISGDQTITEPETVEVYRTLWSRLWDAAVTGDEARAMLEQAEGPA
jgi:transcriptional regulator with XRE-family HTH domain